MGKYQICITTYIRNFSLIPKVFAPNFNENNPWPGSFFYQFCTLLESNFSHFPLLYLFSPTWLNTDTLHCHSPLLLFGPHSIMVVVSLSYWSNTTNVFVVIVVVGHQALIPLHSQCASCYCSLRIDNCTWTVICHNKITYGHFLSKRRCLYHTMQSRIKSFYSNMKRH